MSYPILYSATETNFDHNGIGILSACVSCEVTEEANGIFELAMTYPMDGIHFDDIADRAIIKAKADQFRDHQLFRVYAISKPMNGIVTVLAEHISYDLSGIPVKPFSADSVALALAGLRNNAVVDCPFDFWTDKSTSGKFSVPTPASIRSRLGGVAGSILDVYGGEYEFDNYTVKLHNNRGMNRGVSIRYGKNLTDIQQEQNCSNVATGVYPYWTDLNGENLIELPERIINASGTYNFVKIKTLDLSQAFRDRPTLDQIRSYTKNYIKANNIGVPIVSLSVSFAQLEQYDEYKNLKLLERVSLFDTVNVEFPALGVSATAKAVKMVYDVLSERVKIASLGSVKANIADTIAEQAKEIEKAKKPNFLQKAVENATQWITNGKGYMVAVKDENGNWKEICSLDTPDIDTAVNVWRWNNGGFGFSPNGYVGPYETAITQDGQIVADFITTGSLTASIIKAGILKSVDSETFYLDLENGILKMKATDFSISGKTVDEISQEKANAAEDNAVEKARDFANTAENNAKSDAQEKLNRYAETVTTDINNLQSQIDGSITTWFGDYVPTGENTPASEWTTTDIKNQHLGDLFYIVDNEDSGGLVYRWALTSGVYNWQLVEDVEVAKALKQAAEAKDTADKKRRVFVVQPTPPYDVGDLWTDEADLRVCQIARISGNYNASDWVLATNYIDSAVATTIAENKVNAQTQMDIFNKLTNNGASEGIYIKDGQVYINASYLATGILASKDGETFYLDLDNGVLKGQFSELSISGKNVESIAQEKANSAETNAVRTAATDATAKANSALSSAKTYADSVAIATVNGQTQSDIFNKLTANGTLSGLFMKDGQLYVNASYLATGVISSADGKISIDLTGSESLPIFNTGISTNGLTVRADEVGAKKLLHIYAKKSTGGANFGRLEFFSANGKKLATLTEVFSDSNSTNPVGMTFELDSQNGSTGAFIGTGNTESGFYVVSGGFNSGYFVSNGDFESKLRTTIINEKRISWEYSSELGKYVLCGS